MSKISVFRVNGRLTKQIQEVYWKPRIPKENNQKKKPLWDNKTNLPWSYGQNKEVVHVLCQTQEHSTESCQQIWPYSNQTAIDQHYTLCLNILS